MLKLRDGKRSADFALHNENLLVKICSDAKGNISNKVNAIIKFDYN